MKFTKTDTCDGSSCAMCESWKVKTMTFTAETPTPSSTFCRCAGVGIDEAVGGCPCKESSK